MRPGAITAFALAGALLAGCATSGRRGAGAGSSAEAGSAVDALRPLAEGETGVAILCGKVLTMDAERRVFDPGLVVIRDGRIDYVGAPLEVPEGFPAVEMRDAWAWPGLIDLHSHVQNGSWADINDMVRPLNPELRSSVGVRAANQNVRLACAGGVTTMFGIPGSGTSISGFGLLYKSRTDGGFEDAVLRDPGGMKVAWNFNPQRAAGDLGRTWSGLSWQLERLNDRAAAMADAGQEDPGLDNLMRVHRGELPVLIHCASAEGVAGSARMWKGRYDTNCVISHGSWDGHLAAEYAAGLGVPVNHGPRISNFTSMRREGKILGTAAVYVDAGVPDFSLNTDAGVIAQEQLFLQGSMSARLGADAYGMLEAVTTNPARSFAIADRIGSLEVGKDGDVVVSTGDPLDPRSRVELVVIEGELQYSRERDGQWF